jgi:hypothetical protein
MEQLILEKELLFEGKENATSVKIVDFSLLGVQLEITLAGRISGKIEGQILSTHYILMRPDGTSEFDLKSVILGNGEPILVKGRATGKAADQAQIEKSRADLTFQTLNPKMAYLNAAYAWSEATYNRASGEYTFKVYSAAK